MNNLNDKKKQYQFRMKTSKRKLMNTKSNDQMNPFVMGNFFFVHTKKEKKLYNSSS